MLDGTQEEYERAHGTGADATTISTILQIRCLSDDGRSRLTRGDSSDLELKLFGAYAISAQNDRNFTLYFFFSGLEAQMQTFEIVDANTVRHTAEGWTANRQ